MNQNLAFQQLDIYIAARELAAIVHHARIADAELRDQATRASKSVFLGICEGLPNEQAGLRRRYFTQANNSLHETVGAIDLACAIGVLAPERRRAPGAGAPGEAHVARADAVRLTGRAA